MFIHPPSRAVLFTSAALTLGLLTQAASAQMGRSMGMQSMRPSGMMGTASMGRSTFMGGVGLYPNIGAMMGMGRTAMSPYGMPSAGQGGNSMMNTSYGGYGSGSQRMSVPYQPYGSAEGYASATSPSAESSQQPTGTSQLMALRLFGGGLDWPLALRYLTRDGDSKELRERIDIQVERLLKQRSGRSMPVEVVQELQGDLEELRKHFERQAYDMPTNGRQEADARHFLAKVGSVLTLLSSATARSESRK